MQAKETLEKVMHKNGMCPCPKAENYDQLSPKGYSGVCKAEEAAKEMVEALDREGRLR